MDYQNQTTEYVEMPADYKVWSIVNIVLSALSCCCSCFGIIGLVLSIIALMKGNDVAKFTEQGEAGLIQAQEASSKAKLFNIIASALVGVGIVVGIISFFLGFFDAILNS